MIINGLRWNVRVVSPSHPMLITPRHTMALGMCDKETQTIYLSNLLIGNELKEVLAHELTHAVLFSYGQEFSYDTEEIFAELMMYYGEQIADLTDIIFDKIK